MPISVMELDEGSKAAHKFKAMLLGADPEVFLKNKLTGKPTISCGKIGGKKGNGISFTPNYKGFKWLQDNVAVEFNFSPCNSAEGFDATIGCIWNEAERVLAQQDLALLPVSVCGFDTSELSIPEAQVFGCDPDFVAYGSEEEGRVVDTANIGNNRFGGGHLHFGFNNFYKIPIWALVILVDTFIGLPSLKYDNQGLRKYYYGKAGLYRTKDYGFEYRTLSNFWFRPEQHGVRQAIASEAFHLMDSFQRNHNGLGKLFDKLPLKDIQTCIDNDNQRDAYVVWTEARQRAGECGLYLGHNFQAVRV
jgi:hypothetical protein